MINTELKLLQLGNIRRKKRNMRILNSFLVFYIILMNYDKPFLNLKDLYTEQPFHLLIFCAPVQHSLQDPNWSLSNFSVNNVAIADSLWNWINFLQGIHVIQLKFANPFFILYSLRHTGTYTCAWGLPPTPTLGYTAPFLPPSQHNRVWVNLSSQEVQASTDSNLEMQIAMLTRIYWPFLTNY